MQNLRACGREGGTKQLGAVLEDLYAAYLVRFRLTAQNPNRVSGEELCLAKSFVVCDYYFSTL